MSYPRYANLIHHSENEGKRTTWAQVKMKKMGVNPGEPDLKIAIARYRFHSLYVEFKMPGKTLTEKQKEVHAAYIQQGNRVELVRDFETFRLLIESYLDDHKQAKQKSLCETV